MKVVRGLLIIVILFAVAMFALGVLMVERSPLVTVSASTQVSQADTVNPLLRQVELALRDRHERHVITVSQQQFESLVGVVQRGIPAFRGAMKTTPEAGELTFSIALAESDWYINIETRVLPGDELALDYLRIGDLVMPGNLSLSVMEFVLNTWTRSDIATQARSRIRRVMLLPDTIKVHLAPLDSLLKQLNEVKNGLSVDQDDELKELTAYYFRYIAGRELALRDTPQSLLAYMKEGMARARERSNSQNAALHNKAVILALSVFVGHHRIANFIGDIHSDPLRALKPKTPAILRDRPDLARHFIISGALKLLSQDDISLAIGEFKELMDRAMGGSGYSFVDLSADMAGVAFANVATDPAYAAHVQSVIINASDESVIMPEIDGLPEGFSKQQFEAQYGQVDSPAYRQQVARINARLRRIDIYRPVLGN
ncbi:hypothetical protein [Alteromonas halophila]|uniref:Uncharacterized protein n=1 Tax=Alteromonas halophila TaxID=516698 RepID=A0A918JIF9_9ALTE|nr:hypothetical protein [Alteromonas halophila]GGW80217.1 hypothetical protein GCM10007391_11340 [Alteromonas halophila]